MIEKIISGVISLSIVLFSSYQGNDARFSYLNSILNDEHIAIYAKLENAFETDFENIFKSGIKIEIYFEIKIIDDKNTIFINEFCHRVEFDPLLKKYFVELEENEKNIAISSYKKMLNKVSTIEYDYYGYVPETVNISLKAYLKKLKLGTLNKEFDMMLLWKMKKPKVEGKFTKDLL